MWKVRTWRGLIESLRILHPFSSILCLQIYLDLKKFSLAKEHCKTNINRLYKVMKKEAEYYFDNGKFEESASLYSQLDGISFEEIALKFLQAHQVEALKLYLVKVSEAKSRSISGVEIFLMIDEFLSFRCWRN